MVALSRVCTCPERWFLSPYVYWNPTTCSLVNNEDPGSALFSKIKKSSGKELCLNFENPLCGHLICTMNLSNWLVESIELIPKTFKNNKKMTGCIVYKALKCDGKGQSTWTFLGCMIELKSGFGAPTYKTMIDIEQNEIILSIPSDVFQQIVK